MKSLQSKRSKRYMVANLLDGMVLAAVIAGIVLFILYPIFSVVSTSFFKDGEFTLTYYLELFNEKNFILKMCIRDRAGTEQAQYKMNVTSEALGMQEAEACVAQAGAAVTWDEETQQNYAQWESDGATYKIWLEDSSSIEAKLKLMEKYQLGGVADVYKRQPWEGAYFI